MFEKRTNKCIRFSFINQNCNQKAIEKINLILFKTFIFFTIETRNIIIAMCVNDTFYKHKYKKKTLEKFNFETFVFITSFANKKNDMSQIRSFFVS